MALSFRQKADFFHQSAKLTGSGLSLPRALEMLASRRRGAISRAAGQLLAGLPGGVEAALAGARQTFSALDAAVVLTGEKTGQMPLVLERLAGYYQTNAAIQRALLTRCAYPVVLIHLAILLLPIAGAIREGGTSGYLASVALALGVFYGVVAGIFGLIWLIKFAVGRSPGAAAILGRIPVLGGALRLIGSERFAAVMALETGAGLGVLRALHDAGRASGNAAMQSAANQLIAKVKEGSSLTSALHGETAFSEVIETAILTGEAAGRLEMEMDNASQQLRADLLHWLDVMAEWLPRIVYVGIVFYVAWKIIDTMLAAWKPMGDLLNL